MTAPEPREDVAATPSCSNLQQGLQQRREDVLIGKTDGSVTFSEERDTAVAEVLAAHHRDGRFGCRCGYPFAASALDGAGLLAEHDQHLAEALAPLIAERVRAAAMEAWDEGWWKGRQDRDPTVLGYAENPYRGGGK